MADDPQKPDETTNKFYTATATMERRRAELWSTLAQYIAAEGGFVISSPSDHRRMRIEAPELSSVAIRLSEKGFRLRLCGIGSRVTSSGFMPVSIFELKLPGR
jgi:hypothetical protein